MKAKMNMKVLLFLACVIPIYGSVDVLAQSYKVCSIEDGGPTYVASTSRNGSSTIPIIFHVIHTTSGQGEITQSQILAQVNVLNGAYSSENISFYAAGVHYIEDNNLFTLPDKFGNTTIYSHVVDSENAINVFSGDMPNSSLAFGWSSRLVDVGTDEDLILIDWTVFPGGDPPVVGGVTYGFDLSDILVHEIGHTLGLEHPYSDGSCNRRDSNLRSVQ